MFIELIDLLRCTSPHEDSSLVASLRTVSNRFVGEGTLGCPVCKAEYPITRGVADFTGGTTAPSGEELRAHASHDSEQLATRAGAFLDVTEPGVTVVLGGVWASAAVELSEMSEVRVLALNAATTVRETASVGRVSVTADIPLAPDSCLGVAIDAWFNAAIVTSAVRVVRPGGRIVGPCVIPPPAGLSVLARDADYWVAEKAPQVMALRRASR